MEFSQNSKKTENKQQYFPFQSFNLDLFALQGTPPALQGGNCTIPNLYEMTHWLTMSTYGDIIQIFLIQQNRRFSTRRSKQRSMREFATQNWVTYAQNFEANARKQFFEEQNILQRGDPCLPQMTVPDRCPVSLKSRVSTAPANSCTRASCSAVMATTSQGSIKKNWRIFFSL